SLLLVNCARCYDLFSVRRPLGIIIVDDVVRDLYGMGAVHVRDEDLALVGDHADRDQLFAVRRRRRSVIERMRQLGWNAERAGGLARARSDKTTPADDC